MDRRRPDGAFASATDRLIAVMNMVNRDLAAVIFMLRSRSRSWNCGSPGYKR